MFRYFTQYFKHFRAHEINFFAAVIFLPALLPPGAAKPLAAKLSP
jgi:hypothetical protein